MLVSGAGGTFVLRLPSLSGSLVLGGSGRDRDCVSSANQRVCTKCTVGVVLPAPSARQALVCWAVGFQESKEARLSYTRIIQECLRPTL